MELGTSCGALRAARRPWRRRTHRDTPPATRAAARPPLGREPTELLTVNARLLRDLGERAVVCVDLHALVAEPDDHGLAAGPAQPLGMTQRARVTTNGTPVIGSVVRCMPIGRPARTSRSLLVGSGVRATNPNLSRQLGRIGAERSGYAARSARNTGYGTPVRYGSPRPVRSKIALPASREIRGRSSYSAGSDSDHGTGRRRGREAHRHT